MKHIAFVDELCRSSKRPLLFKARGGRKNVILQQLREKMNREETAQPMCDRIKLRIVSFPITLHPLCWEWLGNLVIHALPNKYLNCLRY